MANTTAAITYPGRRGTGDFISNADRDGWRKGLTRLFPNGELSLTALTSQMKSRSEDHVKFHWFDKLPPNISANIAGIYTNVALSSAYSSGGTTGSLLYIKVTTTNGRDAATTAKSFVAGSSVAIRDETDPTNTVRAKVLNVVVNGSSSYLAVRLLEADDNSAYSRDLSDAATGGVVVDLGTINPEFGEPPASRASDPDEYENRTQIFKDALEISGSAKSTTLTYGDSEYLELKKDALFRHGTGMENAFLWGINTTNTGENGKPERTTMGLCTAIQTYAPDNVSAYNLESAYSGKTWAQSGKDWLEAKLAQIFKYGSDTKMCFAGAGAIIGLNTLAETYGHINIEPGQTSFGLKVTRWITPWGVLELKRHPLFTHMGTYNNSLVIFEPKNLTYVYLKDRDTKFVDDKDSRNSGNLDGLQEYYITEAGLEFHNSISHGLLFGVGQANAV